MITSILSAMPSARVRIISDAEPVTVVSRLGSSSPIASEIFANAEGSAAIMLSTTGEIFFTTLSNATATLSISLCTSASALPSPARRLSNAALRVFMEPLIVFSASAAVVPVIPISV